MPPAKPSCLVLAAIPPLPSPSLYPSIPFPDTEPRSSDDLKPNQLSCKFYPFAPQIRYQPSTSQVPRPGDRGDPDHNLRAILSPHSSHMAEGLIPFVYRALKRRKGLRRYNTLPSASASAAAGAAALAIVAAGRIPEDHAVDYHCPAQHRNQHHRRHSVDAPARPWTPSTLQLGGSARKDDGQHRRWATVDDFEYEEEYRRQQQYGYGGGDMQQQQPPLAKARSSRVFSCITGM